MIPGRVHERVQSFLEKSKERGEQFVAPLAPSARPRAFSRAPEGGLEIVARGLRVLTRGRG
jgi:hypothetical protein